MAPGVTTAAELVDMRADDDNQGLLFEGDQWTWRQVVDEADRRGALLRRLRQDGPFHIGVLLDNTPEYVFLLAGAARVGAVIVGINPTRRGAELAADITRTDCQLIITDTAHYPLLDGLDLGIGRDRILVVDSDDYRQRLDNAPAAPPRHHRHLLRISTSSSSRRGRPGGPRPSG